GPASRAGPTAGTAIPAPYCLEPFGQVVHLRPAQVGYQIGWLASASPTSRAATSRVSTGWKRNPDGTGMVGSFAIDWTAIRIRSWNWVARRVVHASPEDATTSSAARLEAK